MAANQDQVGANIAGSPKDFGFWSAGGDEGQWPGTGGEEPPAQCIQPAMTGLQELLIRKTSGDAAITEVGLCDERFDDMKKDDTGPKVTGNG